LKDVLFWAANRQPVYLYGPAGTGKNVLAKQVAEGLCLDFYYCGCLQNKYELEGFIDAGGNYQETEFFKAFTQGGVFLFDEIDGTAAEVLIAFNAALANGYYNFPKYGKIKAHDNFVCIAAGNTVGRGANDAYNGRFQLDASTLDRFAFVELDYDREIEISAAGGDEELVDFIHTVRGEINKSGLTYTASPRAIIRIAMCLKSGKTFEEGIKEGLTGSWDENDTKRIASRIENLNKYCETFKNMYK
ncbi:MAG TPA: AAA family ATPase, partial [Candidatus Onthomorpha intestinigallinarum]|nr:AAA family ATPase [Candidatus Onthomorpha intestinigallinarum]